MTAFCIIALFVPTLVYSKTETKTNTKTIENIYKEINWKPAKLGSFPTGTYETPIKTINAPQRASTQATGGTEWDAKMFIYYHESGNRPNAINASSGACGLGQALPCSKMNCSLSDYACQDAFFTRYMLARYGTWQNAKSFWLQHRWW